MPCHFTGCVEDGGLRVPRRENLFFGPKRSLCVPMSGSTLSFSGSLRSPVHAEFVSLALLLRQILPLTNRRPSRSAPPLKVARPATFPYPSN